MGKQKQDMENSLKRKEADMFALSVRFEEAQSQAAKVQRQAQVRTQIERTINLTSGNGRSLQRTRGRAGS